MPKIFISHSSVENNLANQMATWIDTVIPDAKCFCSSRPADLVPGSDWLKELYENSTGSDLCLLMLSPDSALNSWIHFEAGLSLGAKISNKAIPILYGGMAIAALPTTLRHLQALDLNDADSFEAFVSSRLLNGVALSPKQTHSSFIENLSEPAKRLLRYGRLALLVTENITTQSFNPISLVEGNDEIVISKGRDEGQVISVRAEIIPRRQGPIEHWKFGIKLRIEPNQNDNDRLFQFHAGCHQGLKSWTIYFTQIPHVPINEPARLDTETSCTLQVWLSRDGWYVGCVGIDSFGNRALLQTDRAEDLWRLGNNNWHEIVIAGWADGAPFQIDVQSLEIDIVP